MDEYTWLLEVSILILLAKLFESLFQKLGLSKLLAYLTIGFVLSLFRFFYGYSLSSVATAFASLGILITLFRAGLESSLRYFVKGFKVAGAVAVGGVLGALGSGLLLIPLASVGMETAFAMGVVLSATSISVTVATLEELGQVGSREAQAIVGAAVIDDVIGLAFLSILQGLVKGGHGFAYSLTIPVIAFTVWFSTAWFFSEFSDDIFRFALRMRVEAGLEALSFALLLLLAYVANSIGLSTILIAYAFGMGLASYRYAAKRVEEHTKLLSLLFTPLFFIYVGSRIDIKEIAVVGGPEFLKTFAIVLSLFFISKIGGCYIAARLSGFDHRKSMIIGVGMIPRAEVCLVAAALALEMGVISQAYFASTIISALVTQFVTPIILQHLYRTS